MRDNGLLRGNSKGAKFVPGAGGVEGGGTSPRLAPRASRSFGECKIWGPVGQGRFGGTVWQPTFQKRKERFWLATGAPKNTEAWPGWSDVALMRTSSCEHFEVAKEGDWGFSVCLTAGVKELCVEPSPALIH